MAQVRMTKKEMIAAGLLGNDSDTPPPPKDKTVHVHTYHHRLGGTAPAGSTVPSTRDTRYDWLLPFVLGGCAGFIGGFIIALILIGR